MELRRHASSVTVGNASIRWFRFKVDSEHCKNTLWCMVQMVVKFFSRHNYEMIVDKVSRSICHLVDNSLFLTKKGYGEHRTIFSFLFVIVKYRDN